MKQPTKCQSYTQGAIRANTGTRRFAGDPGHAKRSDVITPLRERVLQLLAEYTYLRTEHFYELMDAQNATRRRAVRRVLTLIRKAGYVVAQPLFEYREHARGGFPHVSFVYSASQKGARTAAGPRSPGSLAHDILVSEFHLALKRDVAAHPHLKLHWLTANLKKTTNPDAVFGIEDTLRPRANSTFWFFLELERSRQGHWRRGEDSGLLQKLVRYGRYRNSPELRRDWPFIGDFRVIVSVGGERRVENLLRKLERQLPLPIIWVIATDQATRASALSVSYRTPASMEPRSLSALFR